MPNGGIFSTPSDLSKFVLSLMGYPPLLSDESRNEMRRIQKGGKKYAIGLMLFNTENPNIIGHNGSGPGYTSIFVTNLKGGYAVILFRNYNKGSTDLEEVSRTLLSHLREADNI